MQEPRDELIHRLDNQYRALIDKYESLLDVYNQSRDNCDHHLQESRQYQEALSLREELGSLIDISVDVTMDLNKSDCSIYDLNQSESIIENIVQSPDSIYNLHQQPEIEINQKTSDVEDHQNLSYCSENHSESSGYCDQVEDDDEDAVDNYDDDDNIRTFASQTDITYNKQGLEHPTQNYQIIFQQIFSLLKNNT